MSLCTSYRLHSRLPGIPADFFTFSRNFPKKLKDRPNGGYLHLHRKINRPGCAQKLEFYMLKALLAAAVMFGAAFSAQANDSSIPYIEVQGVHPHGKLEFEPLSFYGKETYKFFEAMPEIAFAGGDLSSEYRYVELRSKGWTVSINCAREYFAPLTEQLKNDYMCSVSALKNDPEFQDSGDSFKLDGWLPMIADDDLVAQGIDPYNNLPGEYVSFYGKDTAKMVAVTKSGSIFIDSKAYTMYMVCQEEYVNPVNQKVYNDYMCTIGFYKK